MTVDTNAGANNAGTNGAGANNGANNNAGANNGAQNNAPAHWSASLDADAQGWVANKKFNELSSDKVIPELVRGWTNAEKFIGVPADQLIRLPKAGDAKALDTVYGQLGRPADPKGYNLTLPQGFNEKSADQLRGMFHKYGLNNAQANGIVADLVAAEHAEATTANEARSATFAKEQTALRGEWGQAYAKNEAIVNHAAAQLGLTEQHVTALRDVLGPAATMKMLHKIGTGMGEDSFVASGGQNFGDARSPDQAQADIAALKNDKEFVEKLFNGDVAARQRWSRLHEQAFPTPSAA